MRNRTRLTQTLALVFGVALAFGALARAQEKPAPAADKPGAKQYYVALDGKSDNPGTKDQPWDILSALSAKAAVVKPGDTICLRGGEYKHDKHFTFKGLDCTLQGSADAYITVRPFENERVIINGYIHVQKPYVTVRNLEITLTHEPVAGPSYPSRKAFEDDLGKGFPRGGMLVTTDFARIVNCTIYDCPNGTFSNGASEWYGNIVLGSGAFFADDASCGEGLYAHNDYSDGPQAVYEANIFALGARGGLNMWAAGVGQTRHMRAEKNFTLYCSLNCRANNTPVHDDLIADNVVASVAPKIAAPETSVANNPYNFYTRNVGLFVGYKNSPVSQLTVQRNLVLNGVLGLRNMKDSVISGNTVCAPPAEGAAGAVYDNDQFDTLKMGGNTYYAANLADRFAVDGKRCTAEQYADLVKPDAKSTFTAAAYPAANQIYCYPNKYEPGRMHIFVANYEKRASVDVDLSKSGLKPGQAYEIRYVNNFRGPKISGTYDGQPVSIPMKGWATAQPRFLTTARAMGKNYPEYVDPMPLWGAFVLLPAQPEAAK